MYYIVYIFQMAGLSRRNAVTTAAAQYVINVVMTVPALLFIDKLPRRKVMMGGSFVMAVLLFTTGAIMACFGHKVPKAERSSPAVSWVIGNTSASKAVIACSYLFIAAFACTWG